MAIRNCWIGRRESSARERCQSPILERLEPRLLLSTSPFLEWVKVNGQEVSPDASIDVSLNLGDSFTFEVRAGNNGDYSPSPFNNITFSFSQFDSSSDKDRVWLDSADADLRYEEFFAFEATGGDGCTERVMVEAYDEDGWVGNGQELNTLRVHVKPKAYGVIDVYHRLFASNRESWTYGGTYAPETPDQLDYLGFPAHRVRINVLRPGTQRIHVPGAYSTITEALANAQDGDTIVLGAGTFGAGETFPIRVEKQVNIQGAGIGQTVVEGQSGKDVFRFYGTSGSAVIEGLSITGGRNGAMILDGFAATIRNCKFYGNDQNGLVCDPGTRPVIDGCILSENTVAGLKSEGATPTVQFCTIQSNGGAGIIAAASSDIHVLGSVISYNGTVGVYGQDSTVEIRRNDIIGNGTGVFCWNSTATIINNVIAENQKAGNHDGIYLTQGSQAEILHNTICFNGVDFGDDGSGIRCEDGSSATIANSILWGNGNDLRGCSATYSDISDGDAGEGNISSPPNFAVGYLLQDNSPCIDAGRGDVLPVPYGVDRAGKPRLQGIAPDMGAFESSDTHIVLPMDNATDLSYRDVYDGSFGLGGGASIPDVVASDGYIHSIVNTGAALCGFHGLVAVDAILGEFAVAQSGYYELQFAGRTSGEIYNAGIEPLGGSGSAFRISLGGDVQGMGSNRNEIYVSDLSLGSFLINEVAISCILALIDALTVGAVGGMMGLITNLKDQVTPIESWPPPPPPDEFALTFEGYLEAGRAYGWSFYSSIHAATAAFGASTWAGLVDMEVFLDAVYLRPVELAANTTPRRAEPVFPSDGAWVSEGQPSFEWTPFSHGGDGDTQAGFQVRVRCDTDGDRIVYDTGFIPDSFSSSHSYSPGSYSDWDSTAGCERISEALEQGKHYHWHVRYRDSGGDWSEWSSDSLERHQDFYVNTPPTLTAITTLSGAAENHALDISYDALAAVANEYDADGHTLSFLVQAVTNGWLYKGGSPVTPDVTLLGPGETLVWHPPVDESGTLDAFTVVAWDGLAISPQPTQVRIEVESFNQEPTDISLSKNTVGENESVGTAVGVLSGTDPDAGQSATLTFSLVSGYGDNSQFSIDPATKQLKTAVVFDYESKDSYSIKMRATDSGSPAMIYDELFTINVTNVNEAPTDIALSNNTVSENQLAGTVVGVLSGTDPDAGQSATLTFSLVSGYGDNSQFSIDAATKQLKTAAVFDYESKDSYSIKVRATDSGSPAMIYDEQITISVTNVLDVADYEVFVSSFGQVGNGLAADFNGDGRVDLVDFAIIRACYGNSMLLPEIAVLGNAQSILDGAATSSTFDGTDFGSITQGQAARQRTFTVRNDGGSALTLGTPGLPTGFSLVEGLSASLAAGTSDTFTVQLDTGIVGTKSGDISFSNNDGDENPFNFRITGTVTVAAAYGLTITSCDISDTSPDANEAVTLSGTAGQVHSASGGAVMKVVIGFRDESGNWAGGEPVVISSMTPGTSFQPWSGSPAVINAPSDPGIYYVWVRGAPTLSNATAIAAFKRETPISADEVLDDKVDTPVTTLQSVGELIVVAAAPMVPVVSQPIRQAHGKPLDGHDASNASDDSIATAAFAPGVDLLMPSPSGAGYISGAQAISGGLPATTLYRVATAEYDLRPVGDGPASGGEDDLLVDVLEDSCELLAAGYSLTAND